MKKLLITTFAAFAFAAVNAQDLGAGEAPAAAAPADASAETAEAVKALPPPTGQGKSVAEMQKTLAEEIAPAPTASQAIQDYFNSKDDWKNGYDEENDRIIVFDEIEFDIKNPEVSTDFVELRKEKISELMLNAKAKIIELIMSKMSGSRILEIPGNPIAKQLEKEHAEMNRQLAAAKKQLASLDKSLAEALAQRDSVTPSELVAVISSWFMKAEKANLAEKYDADKKELYKNIKADFEEAQKKYEELKEKAEQIKGTVSREMKTSLSRVAAMPIFGCTVLQQAESITEKNGRYKYQIAIIYSWSGEMQKAAGEILSGHSVKFAPGKKSIKQWIAGKAQKGALSQWCGPRQFIDNKGNMWFIGISCAPVLEDADENKDAREAAGLEAASEVMFALFADVTSSRTLNKLMRTTRAEDGSKQTKIYKDYSASQGESFKDIQISGNGELYHDTLRHAASGLDLQVVVYGVNSGSPKALKDIQTRSVELGIEVNTAQEMERGRQNALRSAYNASQNNPTARREGANNAMEDVRIIAKKRLDQRQKPVNNGGFKPTQGQQAPRATSTLQTGVQLIDDDDDEQ